MKDINVQHVEDVHTVTVKHARLTYNHNGYTCFATAIVKRTTKGVPVVNDKHSVNEYYVGFTDPSIQLVLTKDEFKKLSDTVIEATFP